MSRTLWSVPEGTANRSGYVEMGVPEGSGICSRKVERGLIGVPDMSKEEKRVPYSIKH